MVAAGDLCKLEATTTTTETNPNSTTNGNRKRRRRSSATPPQSSQSLNKYKSTEDTHGQPAPEMRESTEDTAEKRKLAMTEIVKDLLVVLKE